jgi:hypothetical protein
MRTASLTMKQMLILMGIVVLLVFGGTYASMWWGGGGTEVKPPPAPKSQEPKEVPPLTFLSGTIWPPENREHPEQSVHASEWQVPGHHEFWFRNDHNVPVHAWLANKTCTCTEVDMCLLPDDLAKLEASELDARAADSQLRWQTLGLNDQQTALTVPAHAAGGVRLTWKNKERKNGGTQMRATLATDARSAAGGSFDLELELAFVDPVMVNPEDSVKEATGDIEVSLREPLVAGDVRTINLLCWSATRDDFGVTPEPTGNPCLNVGRPEKLSAAECEAIRKRDMRPVLCAYRVVVTVRERTDDGKQQLDLGRFRRKLKFDSDVSAEPAAITIAGLVHGDIRVGHDKDRDVVALGSFRQDVGTSKEIQLTTEQGNIELEVESVPDFLKAELHEEKGLGPLGKTWTLAVTVPPGSTSGVIPQHTYLVLKTKGERLRRLQIPVTGNAYVP